MRPEDHAAMDALTTWELWTRVLAIWGAVTGTFGIALSIWVHVVQLRILAEQRALARAWADLSIEDEVAEDWTLLRVHIFNPGPVPFTIETVQCEQPPGAIIARPLDPYRPLQSGPATGEAGVSLRVTWRVKLSSRPGRAAVTTRLFVKPAAKDPSPIAISFSGSELSARRKEIRLIATTDTQA